MTTSYLQRNEKDLQNFIKVYQDRITTCGEKETYNYLGILETGTINQTEIKGKITKVYIRKSEKLLKNTLCSKDPVKGINTWKVFEKC